MGPFHLTATTIFTTDRKKMEFPETVCDLLDHRVAVSPDSVACLSYEPTGDVKSLTWRQFQARVHELSAAIEQFVDSPGMSVAIRLPSSLQYELLCHAIMRVGCVVVGVEYHSSPSDVRKVLERCDARLLLTDCTILPELETCLPERIANVVLVERTESEKLSSNVRLHLLSELQQANRNSLSTHLRPTGKSLATIVFTSGTTGEPKGIPYRHEQIMAACAAVHKAYAELGESDSTICWLPLSALFQRMVNLLCIASGMVNHFISDPKNIFAEIGRLQPTFLVGVPRFFEKLNDLLTGHDNMALRAWTSRVKYMISGSAPLPPQLLQSLHNHGLLILEAYGFSENAIPNATNLASSYRFGSVGKPLPPNQIRLAPDGELEVKGIGVFSGYIGQESSQCFTADGYYPSGDLGAFDEDGFLYLIGRKRDIFKTSTGRRIGPSRIEAVYSTCPSVDQIVVIGDNQKYLAAILTLKHKIDPNSPASLTNTLLPELRAADQVLSEHERVQAFGVLSRPFRADEVTTSTKLKRDVIIRNHAEFIRRLYNMATPCVILALPDER